MLWTTFSCRKLQKLSKGVATHHPLPYAKDGILKTIPYTLHACLGMVWRMPNMRFGEPSQNLMYKSIMIIKGRSAAAARTDSTGGQSMLLQCNG